MGNVVEIFKCFVKFVERLFSTRHSSAPSRARDRWTRSAHEQGKLCVRPRQARGSGRGGPAAGGSRSSSGSGVLAGPPADNGYAGLSHRQHGPAASLPPHWGHLILPNRARTGVGPRARGAPLGSTFPSSVCTTPGSALTISAALSALERRALGKRCSGKRPSGDTDEKGPPPQEHKGTRRAARVGEGRTLW